MNARFLFLVFALPFMSACTYNYYPGVGSHHDGALMIAQPATTVAQGGVEVAQVTPPASPSVPTPAAGQVDINSFPVLSAATQEYVKSIPPGVYAPMWLNGVATGEDPQHPLLVNALVAVNNLGRVLAADAPKPQDNLPWQPLKAVTYANNPDHTDRLDASGHKIKVVSVLWAAAVRR